MQEVVDIYGTALFTFETPNTTPEDISWILEIMGFKYLIIFEIENDNCDISFLAASKEVRNVPFHGSNSKFCGVIAINNSILFSEEFLKGLSERCERDKDLKIVFILRGIKWSLLITGLRKYNININSRNNTLKRVLLPQQFLFSASSLISSALIEMRE